MCSPLVIPVVAGAAVGIASSVVKGQQEKEVALANARLAERQRQSALQAGALQASRIGMEMRQAQGTALAMAGASGVDTTSGTAGNLLALSAVNAGMDMEQVRANAAMQAWGFEAERQDWYRQYGAASTEEGLGVVGAVLGAGGGMASALTRGR